MSDSKRLRTLKLLCKWLEQEISVANGYKFNLAGRVFRGRAYFSDADPETTVGVVENLQPDRAPARAGNNDQHGAAKTSEQWVLLFNGQTKEDPRAPSDNAYELMADVKKALAKLVRDETNDLALTIDMGAGDTPKAYYLGALINGLECEPGTVRPPEQPTEKAFFWMRVILKFTERVNDPYSYT